MTNVPELFSPTKRLTRFRGRGDRLNDSGDPLRLTAEIPILMLRNMIPRWLASLFVFFSCFACDAEWTGWQTIQGGNPGVSGGIDISYQSGRKTPKRESTEVYFRIQNRYNDKVTVGIGVELEDDDGKTRWDVISGYNMKPGSVLESRANYVFATRILRFRINDIQIGDGEKIRNSPALTSREISFPGTRPSTSPQPSSSPSVDHEAESRRLEQEARTRAEEEEKRQAILAAQKEKQREIEEQKRRDEEFRRITESYQQQQRKLEQTGDRLQQGLKEIQEASERRRNNPESKECGPCNGTGKTSCAVCFGSGEVVSYPKNQKCSVCSGKGKVTCFICRGTGKRQ